MALVTVTGPVKNAAGDLLVNTPIRFKLRGPKLSVLYDGVGAIAGDGIVQTDSEGVITIELASNDAIDAESNIEGTHWSAYIDGGIVSWNFRLSFSDEGNSVSFGDGDKTVINPNDLPPNYIPVMSGDISNPSIGLLEERPSVGEFNKQIYIATDSSSPMAVWDDEESVWVETGVPSTLGAAVGTTSTVTLGSTSGTATPFPGTETPDIIHPGGYVTLVFSMAIFLGNVFQADGTANEGILIQKSKDEGSTWQNVSLARRVFPYTPLAQIMPSGVELSFEELGTTIRYRVAGYVEGSPSEITVYVSPTLVVKR